MRLNNSECQEGTGNKTKVPFNNQHGMQGFENLITTKELAQYLHLSKSYISKLRVTEGLPDHEIGRSVRFKLSEVEAWLNKRKKP